MSLLKRLSLLLLPLIFSGCLVAPQMLASSADYAPKTAANAPIPWPPYLAMYHYSLGILHVQEENRVAAIKEFEKALTYDPLSPQIAIELASASAEQGDIPRAIAICEKVLSHHPDAVDLQLILGGLYMNTKDYGRAVAQYRKVLALDPKNVNAHLYLGSVYSEIKEYGKAVDVFESLLRVDPDHVTGNYYRGKMLAEDGRYGEAETALKKTLTIQPTFDSALIELALLYEKQGKTASAIDALKDYLFLHPERTNARIKLGGLLLREKRYDDAEREFLKILKSNRNNREVRLTMGLLYLEGGRSAQAIQIFTDLNKEYPEDHRFLYLLASAYEEKKDFEQTLQHLGAIPIASDLYGNARMRIAVILKKQGKPQEALAVAGQAVKNKKEAALYAFLSSLQEEGKDVAGAERTLKEGLRDFPKSEELLYTLGALYEKTNRFDESIRQMEVLLKVNPNHADALNFIGYSYADRGIHLDEAEAKIRKALALKPKSAYIMDSLGWLYYRQGRISEALKYLKEASSLLPGDVTITEHFGDVLLKADRTQEALDTYLRALKLEPGNKSLQKKVHDLQKK